MVEKWNCKSRVVAPRIFIPDLPRRVRTPPWPPFPRASPARSHAHATCFLYATPMARYRNFSRGDRRRIPTREKERKKFTRRRLRGAWMQRRDVLGRRSVRPGAAGDSYVAQPPAGAHLSHHRRVREAPFVPRPRRSGRRSSAAPSWNAFAPGRPLAPTHAHGRAYLHAQWHTHVFVFRVRAGQCVSRGGDSRCTRTRGGCNGPAEAEAAARSLTGGSEPRLLDGRDVSRAPWAAARAPAALPS